MLFVLFVVFGGVPCDRRDIQKPGKDIPPKQNVLSLKCNLLNNNELYPPLCNGREYRHQRYDRTFQA